MVKADEIKEHDGGGACVSSPLSPLSPSPSFLFFPCFFLTPPPDTVTQHRVIGRVDEGQTRPGRVDAGCCLNGRPQRVRVLCIDSNYLFLIVWTKYILLSTVYDTVSNS
jgi:hypothetical protein